MAAPLILPDLASSTEGPPVFAVTLRTDAIRVTRRHSHVRGQLLGATQGLLAIDAGSSHWVVPATHAVWIPPNVPHGMRSYGDFSGWSLYTQAAASEVLPAEPCVLAVSGLMREAVARAANWRDEIRDAAQQRLMGVILDEMQCAPEAALELPMPQDARLIRIAHALSARPDDDRRLDDWAKWAAISARTLSRKFTAETGLSLTDWRQRLRLLRALELLATGRPVKMIALDLGYGNVSAFIANFRRTFGVTPGRYDVSSGWEAGTRDR